MTPEQPIRDHRTAKAAVLALPLATSFALPGVSHATDQYTGQCTKISYDYSSPDPKKYRTFRARFHTTLDNGKWNMAGYDYWYTAETGLEWGPHSDERIDFLSGYSAGPSSWHSPDDHTTNVSWVHEGDWKAAGRAGATRLQAHAWFDVPRENDPECDVSTATF